MYKHLIKHYGGGEQPEGGYEAFKNKLQSNPEFLNEAFGEDWMKYTSVSPTFKELQLKYGDGKYEDTFWWNNPEISQQVKETIVYDKINDRVAVIGDGEDGEPILEGELDLPGIYSVIDVYDWIQENPEQAQKELGNSNINQIFYLMQNVIAPNWSTIQAGPEIPSSYENWASNFYYNTKFHLIIILLLELI